MDPIKLTFTPQTPKKLGTIYVVEDSPIELEMVKDYFSKYPGLIVKGFQTGDECVKDIVMSGVSPDMILMDYFLDSEVANSKDGLEVLVKLKEISPYSVMIMHTSVDNQRIVELAKKKGAFDYVIKGAAGYEKLDAIIQNYFVIEN